MNELAALVAFVFVGTVSPGPNNAVLWASGISFGFRRTVPHVVGTAFGVGIVVVGVAAGIGALLDSLPPADLALKVVGSAYLLYIAFRVAGSGAAARANVSHPLTLWQAIAFQFVNPKAWVFAIAAVGTFLPSGVSRLTGVGLLTGVVTIVALGSSSIWAAGGAALGRLVEDGPRRAVSAILAALIVASVVLIWL